VQIKSQRYVPSQTPELRTISISKPAFFSDNEPSTRMPEVSRRRRAGGQQEEPLGQPDGPSRPIAKQAFIRDGRAPPATVSRPVPPAEDETITHHAEPLMNRPAHLPRDLCRSRGVREQDMLDDTLREAAESSGYKTATTALRADARAKADKKWREEHETTPPEVGSVSFDENMLRKAFVAFDLDKNDMVGAKELKHLFAQLGETPTNGEIDGMIALCDNRGEGQVSFEDFLSIFSNPAESLRAANIPLLKELVLGERRSQSGSSDMEDEEGEDSSGSSL